MNNVWLTTLVCAALMGTLLTGCGQGSGGTQTDKQSSSPKTYSKPPEMKIDKAKEYTATLDTTKGKVKIKLFDDDAPVTVNNFVFLSRDHFYDGVKFHRIIKDFMIQTGDPLGNGRGGPGYKFNDELPPKRPYAPGIVAMANAGPNTNGSQFFICTGDQSKTLDPNYTQFGEVVEGMDVVQKIASTPVAAQGGEKSKPTEDVKINSVTIEEK
jgi:cyclophilin family peptidyl-prolyl cis-trans isomerase